MAALLFNPAFVTKSPAPDLQNSTTPNNKASHTTIVVGKLDDVIIFRDNLEYVTGSLGLNHIKIIEVDDLGHRIPENVFEEQVEKLFNK